MTEAKLHTLLVDSPTPLAHPERRASVAVVVARALGVPQAEANQRVRYGGGFLLKNVPVTLARRVGRELAGQGVGTFSVPHDEVRRVGRPKRVGLLSIEPHSLVVAPFMSTDQLIPIPWDEVQALHAQILCVDPESEEREGLPPRRRGGNVASLSPYTKRMLEAIGVYEERERVVLRMGIDLWLRGKLWRLTYDDPGVYSALGLSPLSKSKRSKATREELLKDRAAHMGRYVEWEGVITKVDEARLWLSDKYGDVANVRLDMAPSAALNARACEPGQRLRYRARVDNITPKEVLELSDGEFKLVPHSLENYVHLVRKIVASVPSSVLVPPTTRAFAQGLMPFQGLVFAKPEELEAFNSWIWLATQNGISFNAEEIGDELLEDLDEAIPVDDSTVRDLDDVEDVADGDLEDDREIDSLKILYDSDALEDTRDDEPAPQPLPLKIGGDSDTLDDTREFSLDESAESAETPALNPSLIANTGRLDRVHLDEILKSAGELGDLIDDEPMEADAEHEETMKYFDAKTGRWSRVDPEAKADDAGADAEETAD